MTGIVFIIIGISIAFSAKGVADKMASHWNRSVFRNFKVDGFWGKPNLTSERKYDKTGIAGWFERNLFVMFQDGWHLSNTFRRVGWFIALVAALTMYPTWVGILLITLLVVGLSMFGFHVIYHWSLDAEKNLALRILWTGILIGSVVFGTIVLNNNVRPKKVEAVVATVDQRRVEIEAEIKQLEAQEVFLNEIRSELQMQLDSNKIILDQPSRDTARINLQNFIKFDIDAFLKENL